MNTIDQVIASCPHYLEPCHQSKAREIDKALQAGTPHTALGGKRIRCCKKLLRFKIGRSLRLLYQTTESGHIPWVLITRQRLERDLRRK